jgi:hypothetical protein
LPEPVEGFGGDGGEAEDGEGGGVVLGVGEHVRSPGLVDLCNS